VHDNRSRVNEPDLTMTQTCDDLPVLEPSRTRPAATARAKRSLGQWNTNQDVRGDGGVRLAGGLRRGDSHREQVGDGTIYVAEYNSAKPERTPSCHLEVRPLLRTLSRDALRLHSVPLS